MVKHFLITISLSLILTSALAQAIPEEAERSMARGQAAFEDAESVEDYKAAIQEFKKATKAAPQWANPYFNLGITYEKTKDYANAIKNYKKYLQLQPNASDAKQVKSQIYKLEYKLEKAQVSDQVIKNLTAASTLKAGGWKEKLNGPCTVGAPDAFRGTRNNLQTYIWHSIGNRRFWQTAKFDGKTITFDQVYMFCYEGDRGVDCPVKFTHALKVISATKLQATVTGISMPAINPNYLGGGHKAGQDFGTCQYELYK